jgi:uncharacterized protein (TIGR03086 family)
VTVKTVKTMKTGQTVNTGPTGPTIAALHRSALAATRRFVAGIGVDHWLRATPCAEWNVRELVNHLVAGNLWAAELGAGRTIAEVGSTLDGDRIGPHPLAEYDASAEAAAGVFEVPGALDAPCAVSYGPVPGSVYAGHRFVDVLIHGWDLAVATDQDPTLDPLLVDACWDVVQPQLSMLSASGMFGSRVGVPAGGTPQTRLLAALGRSVP